MSTALILGMAPLALAKLRVLCKGTSAIATSEYICDLADIEAGGLRIVCLVKVGACTRLGHEDTKAWMGRVLYKVFL